MWNLELGTFIKGMFCGDVEQLTLHHTWHVVLELYQDVCMEVGVYV